MEGENLEENDYIGTEKNPIVVKPEKPYEKPSDLISWRAPARVFKNRTPAWFLGLLTLSVVLLVVLVLLNQWSLALVLVALDFLLFSMNMVKPEVQFYAVGTTGIQIGKQKLAYEDLQAFWFTQDDSDVILHVTTYLFFPPQVEMPLPLDDQEAFQAAIETELLRFIPYQEGKQRQWGKYVDQTINRITPWLPDSLVNWYTSLHRRRLEPSIQTQSSTTSEEQS